MQTKQRTFKLTCANDERASEELETSTAGLAPSPTSNSRFTAPSCVPLQREDLKYFNDTNSFNASVINNTDLPDFHFPIIPLQGSLLRALPSNEADCFSSSLRNCSASASRGPSADTSGLTESLHAIPNALKLRAMETKHRHGNPKHNLPAGRRQ